MLASESRCDVTGHALAYKIIVGPVCKGVVGSTLIVGVGVFCEFDIDRAVAACLAVRIDFVIIRVEPSVGRFDSLTFGVYECLSLFNTFVCHGKSAEFGGIVESKRR